MSPWTHATCPECWEPQAAGRTPTRVLNLPEEPCCFCGKPTSAGIYVRKDPNLAPCRGSHPRPTGETKDE